MKLERGDLIAIKTIDDQRITGIVSYVFFNKDYIYCYLIDYDHHQVVYKREVEFVITNGFEIDTSWDEDLFNLDYYLYEMFTSNFYHSYDPDSESEED